MGSMALSSLMTRACTFARETKEYENAFLTQEIQFLEFMQEYFNRHRLRHVQKVIR